MTFEVAPKEERAMARLTNNSNQVGYTYFGLLFAIALIGLALSGAAMIHSIVQQREKEEELLFVGCEYVHAIKSYYESGSGGINVYPKSIDDLLSDPRTPIKKRHLRRPWKDPMTGKFDWLMIRNKEGQLIGVHSLSQNKTIKKTNFDELDALLANKKTYQDWHFIFRAPSTESRNHKQKQTEFSDNEVNNQ